ncbi:prepilin-type N-terminal cleavage/methylation domain-containing protein [Pseudoalteromonas phenolica]|uniref:General secretion pathway protein H n=1 Tax=Pseudoalteromonas phenolica TaxID=161398 RepID=A0A0S2K6G4_9GAMM|nr:prepilin-type N-terminal cleavage/methylation domain-containing protein [Pseudoalteromonas phenolica]ALO43583.1 General secretion pathway protein H [Pseudoalteromonas phenolica]MBE0355252.1 general secretion pathway protein H [Pseudoalteromonas phenolica O-BC30]RXE95245.1 prepilin-type N-terminal cleavage/methylation domain-containing protein [Pseudoalteromonas phenolica O-BC30]TMO58469.1 prepilin-type N-terminal cleavage/methylation domain-containing protein [Pseudoalteromonas phenolica]
MRLGLRQNINKAKGFSLLEVLVVLVIIAMSVKMVSYTFDDAEAEELEKQALRVYRVINLASEFAVLNQIELGFHLDKNVLEFLVFDGEKWAVFDAEELYEPITFGKEYKVNLNIEDLSWSQDNLLEQANWRELMGTSDDESLLELKKLKVPQVLILSSGEVSAFQFSVELSDRDAEQARYFIEGEFIAPVNLRVEPEV